MTAVWDWLSIFGGAAAAVAVVAAAWLAGRWARRRRVDMGHADTAAPWGDDLDTVADAVREEPRPLAELTDAELFDSFGYYADVVGECAARTNQALRAQRDLCDELNRRNLRRVAAEAEDYLRGQA